MVSAEYVPQTSIRPDLLISSLREQHALLIEWRTHFYVLHGVVFDKTVYSSGRTQLAIRKLSLRDPRFSDDRAEVEFNRGANDWGEIQGLVKLSVTR
jgi:hypothetical protein